MVRGTWKAWREQRTLRAEQALEREWCSAPEQRINLASKVLPLIDREVARLQRGYQTACGKGCDWCCRQPITVSAEEAIWVARWMREHLEGEVLSRIVERLHVVAARGRGQGMAARSKVSMLCPMLEEGACSIYPARPLECRFWNSQNAEACRARAHGSSTPAVHLHMETLEYGHRVTKVVQETAAEVGFDSTPLDLTAALSLIFRDGSVEQRWLAGEPAFRPAYQCVTVQENAIRAKLRRDVEAWSEARNG